jgi:hypothetical protein
MPQTKNRKVRVTFTCSPELTQFLRTFKKRTGAPSTSALIERIISDVERAEERREIDAAFEEAGRDMEYQREQKRIMHEFRFADTEAARHIDE